jgi:hypothetical protein
MPETPAGSEENRESGVSDDGASTVDAPTGDTSSASDAAEIARRKWQSDLDRERAARRDAEAEVARLKETTKVPETEMTPAAIASIVRETVRRESQVRDVVVKATKEYPDADPALLADPSVHASPEAFELALKQSHDARSSWAKSERERLAAEIRAEYGIKLDAGTAAGGGDPPKGTDQLTAAMVANAGVDQLRDMDPDQLKRLAHSLPEG